MASLDQPSVCSLLGGAKRQRVANTYLDYTPADPIQAARAQRVKEIMQTSIERHAGKPAGSAT